MFKRILLGVLLVIGLVGIIPKSKAIENRGAFVIDNFQVDILVQQNSVLQVNEIIDVEFSEKRHGIFRNIPVKYKNGQGFSYNMKLDVLSVTDGDGLSIPYQVSRSGGDKVIKIGDPNVEIIGEHQYVIAYEIQKGIRYFDDHDEIYWNPIGTGWPTTIANATSKVIFEDGVDYLSGSGVCFTGVFGSVESDCSGEEFGNGVVFKSNQVLDPYEGLTVAVHLPKGEVREPTFKENVLMFLKDNWGFGIPIAVFILMFSLWFKKGKEINFNKTTIAFYEPPENLTPGEVGYVWKEHYMAKFVVADIVNLAVKGYLDIHEIAPEKSFPLGKYLKYFKFLIPAFLILIVFLSITNTSSGPLSLLVVIFIFSTIFFLAQAKSYKPKYELENKKDWGKAKDLSSHEIKLLEGLFTSNKLGRIKLEEQKYFYADIKKAEKEIKEKIDSKGYFETGIQHSKNLYVFMGLLSGIPLAFVSNILLGRLDLFYGFLLSAPVIVLFGIFMSRKTMRGMEIYWKVKGYKKYIDVAEKHRAEFQAKENIFEKTLPYAMVFGNINKWCKAFEGIKQKNPSWYHSTSAGSFNSVVFANSISQGFTNSVRSNMPSSSGGSSGGGGGGGGGGSW